MSNSVLAAAWLAFAAVTVHHGYLWTTTGALLAAGFISMKALDL